MNYILDCVTPWHRVHATAGTLSQQITGAGDVAAAVKVQGLTAVTPPVNDQREPLRAQLSALPRIEPQTSDSSGGKCEITAVSSDQPVEKCLIQEV